jgi:hypothetical protein
VNNINNYIDAHKHSCCLATPADLQVATPFSSDTKHQQKQVPMAVSKKQTWKSIQDCFNTRGPVREATLIG